jgi:hypothetical protein
VCAPFSVALPWCRSILVHGMMACVAVWMEGRTGNMLRAALRWLVQGNVGRVLTMWLPGIQIRARWRSSRSPIHLEFLKVKDSVRARQQNIRVFSYLGRVADNLVRMSTILIWRSQVFTYGAAAVVPSTAAGADANCSAF